MAERFDVIVVGARCAGAPLAALLARQGARVAVVEQATFPRDTLSTHIIEAPALAFLDRLGASGAVRATGAPFLRRVSVRQEDLEFTAPIPQRPGDVGGAASVRRFLLDPILVEVAAQAGADIRMASKVTGLVHEHGRVAGVQVTHRGSDSVLKAPLVVGADGRTSTIAALVGAPAYNLTANARFLYWAFFEGADPGPDPAIVFHRWEKRFVIACPSDSNLYQVLVLPNLDEFPRYRHDLERSFTADAVSCAPVAEALSRARRVGPFHGMLRWQGFFRQPTGPGWMLIGDAGHFKDPSPGQGIGDAFRQADTLAPAILTALDQSEGGRDQVLRQWGRWRDQDAAEHYWLATDLGKAGPLPAALPEVQRRLLAQGKIEVFLDLFNHRSQPSAVFSAPVCSVQPRGSSPAPAATGRRCCVSSAPSSPRMRGDGG